MRKTIIAILCVITLTSNSFAQHRHSDQYNEIGITGGPISAMGSLIYGSIGFWNAFGSALSHTATDLDLFGEYGLHYYYQVKPWCQVGLKASFEAARLTHYTDTLSVTIKDQSKMAFITLMPSVRFTYLNRPWVRLYSGVDVGCSYYLNKDVNHLTKADEDKDNNFLFAFNVTAFGVNVGKKFFGMFEANFGYDSFLKAGIGVRF